MTALADRRGEKARFLASGASRRLNFRSETRFSAPPVMATICNFVKTQKKIPLKICFLTH
jgi:hypothetical protein